MTLLWGGGHGVLFDEVVTEPGSKDKEADTAHARWKGSISRQRTGSGKTPE